MYPRPRKGHDTVATFLLTYQFRGDKKATESIAAADSTAAIAAAKAKTTAAAGTFVVGGTTYKTTDCTGTTISQTA